MRFQWPFLRALGLIKAAAAAPEGDTTQMPSASRPRPATPVRRFMVNSRYWLGHPTRMTGSGWRSLVVVGNVAPDRCACVWLPQVGLEPTTLRLTYPSGEPIPRRVPGCREAAVEEAPPISRRNRAARGARSGGGRCPCRRPLVGQQISEPVLRMSRDALEYVA